MNDHNQFKPDFTDIFFTRARYSFLRRNLIICLRNERCNKASACPSYWEYKITLSTVESRHGKTLLLKVVHKTDHRWRSPLVQKEDLTRPEIEGWVGEPFLSFPDLVFVPPASSSSSTSRHPKTCTFAPGAGCRFDEFWLKISVYLVNKSLFAPPMKG